MSKLAVDRAWFDRLTQVMAREHYQWLAQLGTYIESIADFGCWGGSEPFVLLWTLDASKVVVVEKEEANLRDAKEQLAVLQSRAPQSLQGRLVEFVVADMSSPVRSVSSSSVDLAFCENVLYYMQDDEALVQLAVNEMSRVVRSRGWVIAVEPKFGAQFEAAPHRFGGTIPHQISDPIDISSSFEQAKLNRATLPDSPRWAYCYQKR